MKACLFCQAISGELDVDKVGEDEDTLAFLDHKPLFPGHVLLIPKRHMVTLDELLPHEIVPLFDRLKVLTRAVPRALGAGGCFVANNNRVSQSVPHLHWHAIPRSKGDGLKGFFWPRQPYRDRDHQEEVRKSLETTFIQEQILDFWFGPPQEDGLSSDYFVKRWFQQDAAFDQEIATRFESWLQRALAGELDDWQATPRGRLALILLLDQFTRNLYRHTARAFVGDPQAQELALQGLELGLDRELGLDERVFFYLPFEHGESMDWQNLSLKAFASLVEAASEKHKARFSNFLNYAKKHTEIIERFGRYPHRNAALQRASTSEEEDFLLGPGSSFW